MPSYLSYLRQIKDSKDPEIVEWRKTDKGVPFPIFKGLSIKESMEKHFAGQQKKSGNIIGALARSFGTNNRPQDVNEISGTIGGSISSRQIAAGVSKIHLPEQEAAKCAEQIIEYTRNAENGDRALIDKAIWNSDPYNKKTFSGVEGKWNRDFKIGDEISGRLISWSKNPLVAIQFESIDDTRKILVIDENPGMDISEFSQESDEEEVLTATNMNFVVKEIKQWEGFDLINLEYKGKKQ